MPPWKSSVFEHFHEVNQLDRKCSVFECKYCGQQRAGNNANRMVRHLLAGCCTSFVDTSRDNRSYKRAPPRPVQATNAQVDNSLVDDSILDTSVAGFPRTGQPSPTKPMHNTSGINNDAFVNNSSPSYATFGNGGSNSQGFNNFQTTPAEAPRPTGALPSIHIILRVTIPDTKEPTVSRLIAVPRSFTFLNLSDALATAFNYRGTSGMFDITNGIKRPVGRPSPFHICIFRDEEQRNKWHTYDSEGDNQEKTPTVERLAAKTDVDTVLNERPGCRMVFLVGPWAHEIEVLGRMALSSIMGGRATHAVCLAGEGHSVVETSDPILWQGYKDAYATRTPTMQQKVYRMFYEKECATGDFNGLGGGRPWVWDMAKVNEQLSRVFVPVEA